MNIFFTEIKQVKRKTNANYRDLLKWEHVASSENILRKKLLLLLLLKHKEMFTLSLRSRGGKKPVQFEAPSSIPHAQ